MDTEKNLVLFSRFFDNNGPMCWVYLISYLKVTVNFFSTWADNCHKVVVSYYLIVRNVCLIYIVDRQTWIETFMSHLFFRNFTKKLFSALGLLGQVRPLFNQKYHECIMISWGLYFFVFFSTVLYIHYHIWTKWWTRYGYARQGRCTLPLSPVVTQMLRQPTAISF